MNLVFIGAPGSGKGTQARRLEERLVIPQLSTGELLRAAIRSKTPDGLVAKEFMDRGELVPDALTTSFIKKRLVGAECRKGFILDGFPRTLAQAEMLDRILNDAQKKLDAVIVFHVDLETLLKRLEGRWVCPQGHGEWHREFSPPKQTGLCDACQAPLVARHDDAAEKIVHRMRLYQENITPIEQHYAPRNIITHVDGNENIEKVSQAIDHFLQVAYV